MPKPTNERAIKQDELIDEGYEPLDPIAQARLDIHQASMIADEDDGPLDDAITELIHIVDAQALHAVREEISVYYPEQLFSPIPYMSFRCGNLWYKTVVLPGETSEEAYKRAWDYVAKQVQDQFIQCKKEFWQRQQSMMM